MAGRTALITGSTSGIGLGIAQSLASQGANVVLNGFLQYPGEADVLKKDIQAYNVKCAYSGADMSKPQDIKQMVEEAVGAFGSVDILVNNAGIQRVFPLEAFPEEQWDAVIAINLNSAFHSMKAAIPHMKAKKWGRIINTASVHGLVASKNKSAYVAAKHGLVGLTKAAALELAGSGITANCINPGWVLTPLVEAQIQAKAKELNITRDEAQSLMLREKQPSEQFVTTEALGSLVSFLCSPAGDQITGISVPVDGGWTSQ
uniref:3-oxoacyl-[acyl-carrier-protein] reductase n=1 Tax=Arcella intermedia TaxID=1963864 RepID=A0A6B2LF82_9EUKA